MAWIERAVSVVVLGVGIGPASAHLTVVADHGGQPAKPYYVAVSGAHVAEANGYHARAQAAPQGPAGEAAMLPVASDRLSPGRVAKRAIHLPPTTTPFFVIGDGALSRRWLRQRRARLHQLHAVGLVVNVAHESGLQWLRRVGNGLVMRPTPGNDIARRLGIAHYPVLITPTAIQQ